MIMCRGSSDQLVGSRDMGMRPEDAPAQVFKKIFFFIYLLAASGLDCGRQDLRSGAPTF